MSLVSTTNISGTDNDFDRSSGTGASLHRYPDTSCLATISLSLWLDASWIHNRRLRLLHQSICRRDGCEEATPSAGREARRWRLRTAPGKAGEARLRACPRNEIGEAMMSCIGGSANWMVSDSMRAELSHEEKIRRLCCRRQTRRGRQALH